MGGREVKQTLYEQFARLGKAVASPKRIELLDLLCQGERTVEGLAEASRMGVANTSAHLQVLRQACLVETRREGAKVFYRLADEDVCRFYFALRELARRHLAEVEQVIRAYFDARDDLERSRVMRCCSTDAAQAVGKVPISVRALGVDLLTVAGHKMYAPKGVGALYVRRGVALEPLIPGGGQERGIRSGTENVAAVAGLGMAAALASDAVAAEEIKLCKLRDLLFERLQELLPGAVVLNGDPLHRLPNTLNVSLLGTNGAALLGAAVDVAASTGSACHSGPEHTITRAAITAEERERARARDERQTAASVRLATSGWRRPTTGPWVGDGAAREAGRCGGSASWSGPASTSWISPGG